MKTLLEVWENDPSLLGSGRMIALVEYLLNVPIEVRNTSPKIAEMTITSDGFVMARVDGDIGMNLFSARGDVERNLRGIVSHFGLSDDVAVLMGRVRGTIPLPSPPDGGLYLPI